MIVVLDLYWLCELDFLNNFVIGSNVEKATTQYIMFMSHEENMTARWISSCDMKIMSNNFTEWRVVSSVIFNYNTFSKQCPNCLFSSFIIASVIKHLKWLLTNSYFRQAVTTDATLMNVMFISTHSMYGNWSLKTVDSLDSNKLFGMAGNYKQLVMHRSHCEGMLYSTHGCMAQHHVNTLSPVNG